MKDDTIEIINDSNEVKVDDNKSADVVVSETNESMEPQVLETKVDKKQLKKEEKQRKKEEKLRKKLEKKNKGKNVENAAINEQTKSNAEESAQVTIVETAITKGSAGSQVIGKINGESIVATNVALPEPIDITVKQKVDTKNNNKKVKVVSKKEKIMSILISIFVIIVFAGAGFVAYYFGYKTNPSIYELKNVYLELGEQLPSTVSYYIESSNQFDDMEYVLDLSNVAQNIVGSYTYSISHKNVTKSAQVIVRDTKSPSLTIRDSKDLVFQKNAKVSKDDIVLLCDDLSNCTYKTEYEIDTETPGEKDVTIIARDDAGNETKEVVKIKVIDIQKTLVCTSSDVDSIDKTFKKNTIYTLNFDGNDYLVKQRGIIQYTYSDYAAYFEKFAELQNDDRYTFNRMNFTYSELTDVVTNNLTNLNDLVKFYNDMGYTCK